MQARFILLNGSSYDIELPYTPSDPKQPLPSIVIASKSHRAFYLTAVTALIGGTMEGRGVYTEGTVAIIEHIPPEILVVQLHHDSKLVKRVQMTRIEELEELQRVTRERVSQYLKAWENDDDDQNSKLSDLKETLGL